jgi:hypothetical protein
MKLQIHSDLRNPQTIEASRVVVLDAFDNPIAVAVEIDGVIYTEVAENEGAFNAMLRNLGIDKTVVIHTPQQRPLPSIHIPGM